MSKLQTIGTLVLGIIMLMPVMGMFFPPDIWLHYPGNDISVRDAPIDMPLTQSLVRFTYVAAIIFSIRNWRGNLSEVKYSFLVLVQLIGFSSSVFWSEDATQTFKQAFDLLILYLLMLHVVHKYTLEQFVALLTRLCCITGIASVFVLVTAPGMSHNLGAAGYGNTWRGAFVQKNAFGEICSFAVLAATYSWYTRANSRKLAGFVIAMNAVLLVGSDSITSILTTALGLAIYAIAYLSRSFFGKLLLLFLALGIGLVAIAVLTNVHSAAGLVGRTSGLTGRTALWQVVKQMIAQKPMHGYGLGFWIFQNHDDNTVWLAIGWGAPEAHNDVLDVLLQTGYVGLTFYLINNFTSLFLALRRFGKLQDGSIFCLVIIVVFFYRSYTETASVGTSGRAILILYIVQAYLYKLSFSRQPATQSTVPSSRQRTLPAASGAI